MPLDWEEQRSERWRSQSKQGAVVRGLAFRSYFSSTPPVCNANLTVVQRVPRENRSPASGCCSKQVLVLACILAAGECKN